MGKYDSVKGVTFRLRPAMDGVVLRSRYNLKICGVRTLKTTDEGRSDPSSKERVLTISLLAATPSGIAIDVDVRRPEGESVVNRVIFVTLCLVVFGTCFSGDGIDDAIDKRRVPG